MRIGVWSSCVCSYDLSRGLEGKSVVRIRQASNTVQLYGSVSARDQADALEADGATVSKNQIVLDRPIKALGVYDVRVALHSEVAVVVKVNIARSPEEADLQAQGVDINAQFFEREDAGFTEASAPNAEPGEIGQIGRASSRERGGEKG